MGEGGGKGGRGREGPRESPALTRHHRAPRLPATSTHRSAPTSSVDSHLLAPAPAYALPCGMLPFSSSSSSNSSLLALGETALAAHLSRRRREAAVEGAKRASSSAEEAHEERELPLLELAAALRGGAGGENGKRVDMCIGACARARVRTCTRTRGMEARK
jgi:hypothetical protein